MTYSSSIDEDSVIYIALSFLPTDYQLNIKRIESGLINQTFIISPIVSNHFTPFILQLVCSDVFQKPIDLVFNYQLIEQSLQAKVSLGGNINKSDIIVPKLLFNFQTNKKFIIYNGNFWRAFEYIPNSISYNITPSEEIAFNLFSGLSLFHYYTSNISSDLVVPVIPDFHNTPKTLSNYKSVLSSFNSSDNHRTDSEYLLYLISIAEKDKSCAFLLEYPKALNDISFGLIHGDPKINNFLFDEKTDKFISLIDLDTFQSGYILYDLADCIRSTCNPLGEEPSLQEDIYFSLDYFEKALYGYFSEKKSIISKNDLVNLPNSIKVITYELALRFLTDYLKGNVYFHINYENHNLDRADAQFRLLESINYQWDQIIEINNSLVSSMF